AAHSPRPARPRAHAGRLAACRGAARARGRGRRPGRRVAACRPAPPGRGGAGGNRQPPVSVRHPAADVDPAVPQLLLPIGQRQCGAQPLLPAGRHLGPRLRDGGAGHPVRNEAARQVSLDRRPVAEGRGDRKSTRLNSSHGSISYAVFCLKKKREKLVAGSVSVAAMSEANESTRRTRTRANEVETDTTGWTCVAVAKNGWQCTKETVGRRR